MKSYASTHANAQASITGAAAILGTLSERTATFRSSHANLSGDIGNADMQALNARIEAARRALAQGNAASATCA